MISTLHPDRIVTLVVNLFPLSICILFSASNPSFFLFLFLHENQLFPPSLLKIKETEGSVVRRHHHHCPCHRFFLWTKKDWRRAPHCHSFCVFLLFLCIVAHRDFGDELTKVETQPQKKTFNKKAQRRNESEASLIVLCAFFEKLGQG